MTDITKEQLISYGKDYLKDLMSYAGCSVSNIHKEFVKEAIKVLEQQPSEDCVSRKSLLNKLDPLYKEKIKIAPDNMAEGFMQVSNLIKHEPPVTPTFPKGATNGDMIKAMFPKTKVCNVFPALNNDEVYYISIEFTNNATNEMRVMKSWWNAPYERGDENVSS